uniref:Alkaline ceramidase n=1 Tax=Neobodo designis TaxID=312471 RepID=A0A7S1Q837_NEODS|mmetsp:Transcript_34771/g.107380  ORF Transcript_34771/g.107380 Transcript_34771/m.107380 type:complete len:289 (+) Transcript_34771:160-1026(+)|eukprot:CAMPEP_0174851344 /NCGR_PEP_ID=MMETSP1114-20130205/23058_1 /TAXON_ID=312471 /ORGANISM="Neobodo designis, Strain CCAP 1951/1" /LENGTH=288 /DNA_ID=CAMNT_0016085879 /DNA_START=156 /DNA_END=1022 /DNA_ORIENTATION=-
MVDFPVTFEPDAALFNKEGYWGPRTAGIDWCERNYQITPYIAEFWNTTSNWVMIAMALWGLRQCRTYSLEPRFYVGFLTVVIIGIGSTAFHMTLSYVGQQGDESPMIITLICWWYHLVWLHPETERRYPIARRVSAVMCFVMAIGWTVVHYIYAFVLVFQVAFGVVIFAAGMQVLREVKLITDVNARALGFAFTVTFMSAFGLWLVDNAFCGTLYTLPMGIPNPQFHAWWHALTGISCYIGPAFLIYRRSMLLGRHPVTGRLFGCIPYVHLPAKIKDEQAALHGPELV